MDMFACDQCNALDLITLAYPQGVKPGQLCCTECQTGQWHGQFPKQQFDPNRDIVINRNQGYGLG